MMHLELGTWVAVCDGQKALLFENKGRNGVADLKTREAFVQENPPSHEQGSAPPGRVFSSKGAGHSATAETDFHEQKAVAFLGKFAAHLNREVEERRIESLVVVAPARALGILRAHLSEHAKRVVTAEWDKDYVKLPVVDIALRLMALESRGSGL